MTDQETPQQAPPVDLEAIRASMQEIVQAVQDKSLAKQDRVSELAGIEDRFQRAVTDGRVPTGQRAEVDRLRADLEKRYRPTVESHVLEQGFLDYASEAVPETEHATALTNLADFFATEYQTRLDAATTPDEREAAGQYSTTAQSLQAAHDAVTRQDQHAILTNLRGLPRMSVLDRRQERRVKAVLSRALAETVVAEHTINGERDNQVIADELFTLAREFNLPKMLPDDAFRDYKDRITGQAQRRETQARQERAEQEQRFMEQRGDFRRTSRFEPSAEELTGLLTTDDPWRVIEDELRKYEAGFTVEADLSVRAAYERLQLILYHIESEAFMEDWNAKSPLRKQMAAEEFRELVHKRVDPRIQAQSMRLAIQTGDFQKILPLADQLGSGGWFNALRQNKAQIALNLLEQKMEEFRLVDAVQEDDQGNTHVFTDKVRLLPRVVKALRDSAEAELRSNHRLYGYKNEDDAVAGLNTAYNLFVVAQRQAYHVSLGKSPIESMTEEGQHPFLSEPDQDFAQAFNVLDFGLEKSFTWDKLQRKWFAKLIEFTGFDANGGKGSLAEKQRLGRARLRDIVQIYDVFSSGWRTQKELEVLEKVYISRYERQALRNRLSGESEAAARNRGRRQGENAFGTIALGIKLKRAGQDHRWQFDTPLKDREEALRGVWEQIGHYRPHEIIKIFAEKNHFKTYVDKNGEVQYVTKEVDNPLFPGIEGKKVEQKVLDVQKEHVVTKLLAGQRLVNAAGERITTYKQLEEFIMPHFTAINNLLGAQRDDQGQLVQIGLPAIDYAQDYAALDPQRRAIVDRVFAHHARQYGYNAEVARDRYFELMKKLSQFTRNDGIAVQVNSAQQRDGRGNIRVINELMHNDLYEDIYRNNIRFLDDARLLEMEDLDKDEITRNLIPITHEFYIGGGVGSLDMFRRAWNDMAEAVNTIDVVRNLVTTIDPNTLLQQQQEFDKRVKSIEGFDQARTNAARIIGAWVQAARAPNIYNFTGLTKLPLFNRSEFQKIFGKLGPVMDLDDIQDMRNVLNAAGVFEYMPKNLRDKLLGRVGGAMNIETFWLYKAWVFMIILSAFLSQAALQESQKSAEEAER